MLNPTVSDTVHSSCASGAGNGNDNDNDDSMYSAVKAAAIVHKCGQAG